jgi:hypothetical protein
LPVSVTVPTRVRVDSEALAARRDDLADALGAAAQRALAASVENVLEPRGSYACAYTNPPEFTWLGTGLGAVPGTTRAQIETLLADAIADAARAAGVLAGGDKVSQPLEQVAERVDRDRYDGASALYSIPSYAGGNVNVRVGGDADRIDPSEPVFDYVWRPLGGGSAWYGVYLDKLDEFGVAPPESGYLGAIFLVEWGTWAIAVLQYPQVKTVFGQSFGGLKEPKYDPQSETWKWVDSSLSADVWYEIRWIGDAGPGAAGKIREVFEPGVRRTIEEKQKLWARSEIDVAVNGRLDAIVSSELATPGTVSYMILNGGGIDTLLRWEMKVPAELLGVQLLPLADLKELPKQEGEGAGGGGGAGAGAGVEGPEGAGAGVAGAGAGGAAGAGGQAAPVIVRVPGAQPGGELTFPSPPGAEELELVCEPYLGEPKVSELGSDGVEMRRRIEEIARDLQIQPCEYAATFLLNAVEAVAGRAASVAKWDPGEAEALRSTPAGQGNLGYVEFTPSPSLQVRFLRHLATVVRKIDDLHSWVSPTYQANADLISGGWKGQAISWLIRFDADFFTSINRNVGWVFITTCQVLFLQLLNSSKVEIEKRYDNHAFAENFRQVLLPELQTLEQLVRAKEILANAELIATLSSSDLTVQIATLAPGSPLGPLREKYRDVHVSGAPVKAAVARPGSWDDAIRAVTDALMPATATPAALTSDHFELMRQGDGTWLVRDRTGHVWSAEALETAITLRRGVLESAEPLVKQLVDLPEVVARFSGSAVDVEAELNALLREMYGHNRNVYAEAKSTPMKAVRSSRIVEDAKARTVPYASYALQGIHLLAHEQIGEFFGGSAYWGFGIREVLHREEGRKSGLAFLEFAGIVLLAVVCPPAAAVVGAELAVYHYIEALEKEAVYKALIDPELVLTHAEVEAELFAAKLGLVLSLIPVAAELGAEFRAAFGAAARAGVSRAGLFSAEALAAHLLEVAERGFAESFAIEFGKAYVMNKAIEISISPVMESLQKQWAAEAPVGGVERALAQVLARIERRRELQAAAAGGKP